MVKAFFAALMLGVMVAAGNAYAEGSSGQDSKADPQWAQLNEDQRD